MDKVSHLSRFKKLCDQVSALTGARKLTDEEVLTYFQALEKYRVEDIESVVLDIVLHDSFGRRFPAIGEIVTAISEIAARAATLKRPRFCKYCDGSGALVYNEKAYACRCVNAHPALSPIPDDYFNELFPTTHIELTREDLRRDAGMEMFLPIKVIDMVCQECGGNYELPLRTHSVDMALRVVHGKCLHLCDDCLETLGRKNGLYE